MATKTLYVGNLPYSLTESDLTSAFANFGGRNARIIEGRGFGFVDIESEQLDEAVSAMNGKDLSGRTLTVNEARPKEDRPRDNYRSGGGGGGGYSGGNRGGQGGGKRRSW